MRQSSHIVMEGAGSSVSQSSVLALMCCLPLLQVKVSLAAVYGFMALVFPALLYFTGPLGFIKFWLMPWLG